MPQQEPISPFEQLTKNVFARIATIVTGVAAVATVLNNLTHDVILTTEGLALFFVIVFSAFVAAWRIKKVQEGQEVEVYFYAKIPRVIAGGILLVAAIFAIAYAVQVGEVVIQRGEEEKQLAAIQLQTLTPHPTAAPSATFTLLPGMDETATTQAQSTATAQASATQQVALAKLDGLVQNANKAFSSSDGVLDKPAQPNFPKSLYSRVFLKNFVAEARISNPADRSVHPWDYGFGFRRVPIEAQPNHGAGLVLFVDSDSNWVFRLNTGETSPEQYSVYKLLASGRVKNFDVSPNGSNLLRIVAQENTVYFFVNGDFVAMLDASSRNEPGDIWLGSGFQLPAHMFPGLAPSYKDFTVSSLP